MQASSFFCSTLIYSLNLSNNSSFLRDRFNWSSPCFSRTNQRQLFTYAIQFKTLKQGLKGDFAEIKKQKKSTEKYVLGNKQQQDSSMNYCPIYTFMMAVMLGTKI
jgi:hypothetical protein